MKSIKGLSVNRVLGSFKRKSSSSASNSQNPPPLSTAASTHLPDGPEVTARNSVHSFCESGGNARSDEVLFLPPIVDAAESSPAAAAECARAIRKYIGKEYLSQPSWQYNAIMLVRILTDNPGETFTRNLADDKFVATTKTLLKAAKHGEVAQILMETLDEFEHAKSYDGNLTPLIEMWRREKGKAFKNHGGQMPAPGPRPPPMMSAPPLPRHAQNYFAKSHHNRNRLPDPVELASRLEEARSSAKLLEQVVMNTPPSELLQNELVREFANRCLSASRSVQHYMVSENPAPDNETMESLIDTNEQLQAALSQHQRAVLSARKQLGIHTSSTDASPAPDANGHRRPSTRADVNGLSPGSSIHAGESSSGLSKGKRTQGYELSSESFPAVASGSGYRRREEEEKRKKEEEEQAEHVAEKRPEDPFRDPVTMDGAASERHQGSSSRLWEGQRFAHENFHPGFTPASTRPPVDKADAASKPLPPPSPPSPPRSPAAKGLSAGVVDDSDLYDATPRSQDFTHRR